MSPEDDLLADADQFDQDLGRLDTFLKKLFLSKEKNASTLAATGGLKPSPDSSDFVDQDEAELELLEAGTRIGRFSVRQLIGFGGFGVVYQAVDEQIGLEVALKVPRQDRINSAQILKRFNREARLAKGLEHPSIVRIIETSMDGDTFYIASEFQKGPNLKQWVEDNPGPMPVEMVVGWGVQLAEALQYAFLNGIVHRDLKPTNIMIVPNEGGGLTPRITDFGLAYSVNEPVSSTSASGMLIGTPGYMAPEQVLSGVNRVDIRADIYALGLIMAELLSGVRIRKYDHLMEFVIHLTKNDPERDLDILKKKLPADLHSILLKSIEAKPENRYQTPRDFLEDLQRFQRQEAIMARPLNWRERAVRFMRRKPYQAALILVSCGFFSYFLGNRYWQQLELGRINTQLGATNDSLTKSNLDLGKTLDALMKAENSLIRQAYNSSMRLAYSEFRDGHVEAAQDILDTTRRMKYKSGEELPEFSWRYLSKLTRDRNSGHHADEFDAYLPEPYGTRYRQIYEKNKDLIDSQSLLFGEFDLTEKFAYFRSGFQQMLLEPQPLMKFIADPATGALVSSDGIKRTPEPTFLLVAPATRQRIQIQSGAIALNTRASLPAEFAGKIKRKPSGDLVMPYDIRHYVPIFSMNGQVVMGLVAVEIQGVSKLEWIGYDFQRAEPIDLNISFDPGIVKGKQITMPSLGQSGRLVMAYEPALNTITLYDQELKRKRQIIDWKLHSENSVPISMVIDESRQRLFIGDSENRIRLWKTGEQQPQAEYPNRISTLSDVGLLTDGQVCGRIAYSDRVWVWDPDRKPEQDRHFDLTDEVWSLAFDPSGEILTGCGDDDRVHVWNMKTGVEKRLEKHESLVSCGRFSPDGTRFAACDFSGWIRVWKTADWSLERKEQIANDKLRSLAWGPDNQTILAVGNGKSAWVWIPGDVNVKVRPLPIGDLSHDVIYSNKHQFFIVSKQTIPSAVCFISSPGLEIQKILPTKRRPARLTLSPDESLLVVGFYEGGFEVYNTTTYELVKSVGTENSAGQVNSLIFFNNGKNLITSGGDKRLTIYETETWEPIGTIMDHNTRVNAMAVSADGNQFASGDMSGQIIVRKSSP